MLLIAVYYKRCGRNLRDNLYTAINSLSANHAYLKTLYAAYPITINGRLQTEIYAIFQKSPKLY